MSKTHRALNFGECEGRALKMRLYLSILLAFIFLPSLVGAAAPSTLTLSDAVQRSLTENPSLRAFPFRYAALQAQAQVAELRPALEWGLDAENIGGTGSLSSTKNAEMTIALSSVIELGDKRSARQGVVSYRRSVIDANRQVESLTLLGEVTRRYVDVLAAQNQFALAVEATQLANESLKIVRRRGKAGAAPEAEIKRAQAATAQARLTLLAQQQRFSYLKLVLSALWGSTKPDFDRVEGDLFQFGADVSFDNLYAKVEKNPAIEIFAAESRLKEAELRLAQSQSSADINWSVGVRSFQESNDAALVAGLRMPLFSAKRNSGAIATAYAEKDQIFVQRDVALLKIHTQLFRAFHNRKHAILMVKTLNTSIIPALEDALVETQAAYQRGRYSYLEYVSAQQELLSAKREKIEAAAAALRYGAEIEQLTAEPLAIAQHDDSDTFSGSTPK